MPSDTPVDGATATHSKSKQERIRDNQRRSRARRQEYLADLERRLSECQVTCREADIQRAAILELQIENARLRELLNLAGVNEQFVDHYVSQALARSGQFPQATNPALRQLKPKIVPIAPQRQVPGASQSSVSSRLPSRQESIVTCVSTPMPTIGFPDTPLDSSASSSDLPLTPFPITPVTEINSQTTFGWTYQLSPSVTLQTSPQEFCCSTFGIHAKGPVRVADDNAILCSVAKLMIDQYSLSEAEKERVMSKLAEGFCQPKHPGDGCSVDNQTLFQVLNELSNRYSVEEFRS